MRRRALIAISALDMRINLYAEGCPEKRMEMAPVILRLRNALDGVMFNESDAEVR